MSRYARQRQQSSLRSSGPACQPGSGYFLFEFFRAFLATVADHDFERSPPGDRAGMAARNPLLSARHEGHSLEDFCACGARRDQLTQEACTCDIANRYERMADAILIGCG